VDHVYRVDIFEMEIDWDRLSNRICRMYSHRCHVKCVYMYKQPVFSNNTLHTPMYILLKKYHMRINLHPFHSIKPTQPRPISLTIASN
jgi:hypothetical protein